jgi:hypothetical protein
MLVGGIGVQNHYKEARSRISSAESTGNRGIPWLMAKDTGEKKENASRSGDPRGGDRIIAS